MSRPSLRTFSTPLSYPPTRGEARGSRALPLRTKSSSGRSVASALRNLRPPCGFRSSVRLIVLLLAGTFLGMAPGAAAAAPAPCEAPGSKTVERNKTIRVYRVRGVIYGCVQRTGRRVRITEALDCSSSRGCTGQAVRAVTGRYVATISPGPGSVHIGGVSDDWLAVFDVVRRRTAFIYGTRGAQGVPPYTDGRIEDVVLTPGGRAAWIARFHDYKPGTPRPDPGFAQVYLKGRTIAVADEGTGIASLSLTIAGTRAYWFRDDAPRTALLPD